ncbi:SGNH hydrolase [Leucosporidium creatinivorum]|uniref:SGNH hydrolase n=1 Tax=Leucosporidium creatinivorum TaxID=106004 RepID=A0A1Y2F3I3_9BASI|nr:SGNH hydrolase [Leucosporidium creatinivorum]
MAPTVVFRQVAMLGDSITQQSWGDGGTGAALANAYQRKLDVLNRGLSGYNTAWALPVAQQWLPKTTDSLPETALLIIWFGANDAALPPSPQALTIEEFKANLHTLISLVRSPTSPHYSPSTKILLITPPPVDAEVRGADLMARDPPRVPDRDAERTRQFAEAVKEVGKEAEIPAVDAWSRINEAAERDGGLTKYLNDGLHLTAEGYKLVTVGVSEAIHEFISELHWDHIEQTFPHWADIPNLGALGPQFLAPDSRLV